MERRSHGSPVEVLAPQAPVGCSQWKAKSVCECLSGSQAILSREEGGGWVHRNESAGMCGFCWDGRMVMSG